MSATATMKCKNEIQATNPCQAVCSPRTNIKETAEAYLVEAEMPGVGEKDVVVTVENNVLKLSGQRPAEKAGKVGRTYQRHLRLPNTVDYEKIGAEIRYGVLKLTLPKSESVKPKTIKVRGVK